MSLHQIIVEQFKQPHGFLGKLAGHIMANRSSNIERNQLMLELLNLKIDDRILEIGFGPGIAIEGALQVVKEGLVVGIDHSPTMLKQAAKRNAVAVSQGRARLLLGDIFTIPLENQLFDYIYSVNVVQFWGEPQKVFVKIHELLASNGTVATMFMPRNKGATSEQAFNMGDKIKLWLLQAGFESMRVEARKIDGTACVCVVAIKTEA